MSFTRFATSEPFDPASGERLNKLGDELQEQINDCSPKNQPIFTSTRDNVAGGEISFEAPKSPSATIKNRIRMDVYDNKIRIFEDGNGYKGAHINISNCGAVDLTEIATTKQTVTTKPAISDADKVIDNGVYHYWNNAGMVNFPPSTALVGTLIVFRGVSFPVQLWSTYYGELFYRARGAMDTEWSKWERIATTTKVHVPVNSGWSIAAACSSEYSIVGNTLTYSAILVGDGTNLFPVKLPIPKDSSGNPKWMAGSAIGNNNTCAYLVIQPDGWVSFQSGYGKGVYYAINISYQI